VGSGQAYIPSRSAIEALRYIVKSLSMTAQV